MKIRGPAQLLGAVALALLQCPQFLITPAWGRSSTPKKMGAHMTALIRILDIAGQTPEHVASIIGSPTDRATVNPSNTPCPCDKFTYRDGAIEIVYISGLADWITINKVDGLTMSPASLLPLGLTVSAPTLAIPQTMRWHDLDGLLEVHLNSNTAIPGDSKPVDWIYIKAATR